MQALIPGSSSKVWATASCFT
jgi:hypothetical protein